MRREQASGGLGFTTGYYRFYYRLLPVVFRTGSQGITRDIKGFSLSTTGTTGTTRIDPFLTREGVFSTNRARKNSLHGGWYI